jgi:hypothetical protein
MKYTELPVGYLPEASEVLLFKHLDESPSWEHHPFIPKIKGDKLEVCTANIVRKDKTSYVYSYRSIKELVVESDAWWLNNEHTMLAVRCKWTDIKGDVWWKKNSSTVWFFEFVAGEWIKRKLANKDIRLLVDSLQTFQDLDW